MFIKFLTFFYIISISFSIFAQSGETLTKARYNQIFDSLTTRKSSLTEEKSNLLAEIDSLNNLLVEMEERCKSARSEKVIRKYGRDVGKRILQGQVWKGMSEKMLEESWGKPDRITKNKEKWGTFTQWYYGDITYFFRDGEMIDWEEKK